MLQAGIQVAEANVVTVIGMVDVEWTVAIERADGLTALRSSHIVSKVPHCQLPVQSRCCIGIVINADNPHISRPIA
ncbi:hypothetical protein FHX09_001208 [Rhizobium sp. BK538]|nr:hypothetical protein [Rhizobium sp. BK538]